MVSYTCLNTSTNGKGHKNEVEIKPNLEYRYDNNNTVVESATYTDNGVLALRDILETNCFVSENRTGMQHSSQFALFGLRAS